ncbi:hypothetical protein BJY01DRAFT_247793 [Aspergillus pseudoustus]|uniref:CMP/dCMP-type deaminase domain-containing protein n=1 Tax=Aspergillus pseudoustus TaxID=1810923 RepID=A0ABR4JYS2_9EURO
MPSTPPLPTLAIVAGAWQSLEHYEPLQDGLAKIGYESVYQAPPSNCLPHGVPISKRILHFCVTASFFRWLTVARRSSWVCTHSPAVYGGGALKGLSKNEYAHQGKLGGVVAVVYIAEPCVPCGTATLQLLEIGEDLVPWVSLDESTGLLSLVEPVSLLFHKLPLDEARS